MALPPLGSLRRTREIREVFRRGRCAADGIVAVHFVLSGGPGFRAAIVVSQRVGRSGVGRNLLRRRLREILRRTLNFTAQPHDLVVVARPGAREAGFWALHDSLTGQLAKRGLLRSDAAMAFPPKQQR